MNKFFFVLLGFFALFFSGSVYAATETVKIYPIVNGRTFEDRYTNWESAINSLTARIASQNEVNQDMSNSFGNGFGPNHYSLNRLHFIFDTAYIPDDAIIESSSFNFFGRAPDSSNGLERRIYLVSSDPGTTEQLQTSDFSRVGQTAFGVTDGSWNIESVNSIPLDETGLSYIDSQGLTSFALRGWYDFNSITPTNENELYVEVYLTAAPGTSTDPYLEVTYTVPDEPEPEVDPLVLQYAPKLFMHEDESYDPMNVEAYVDASALWDSSGADTQVMDASSFDMDALESLIENEGDTSGYYMAFSNPDTAGSVDLGNAKSVYEQLVDSEAAKSTMYYHKTNATALDGREFIVLQYWFFYAMNDWKEHGGVNNHEGDWESVFVFLDADTEKPEYVAFSSHLNDGDVTPINGQYLSVLRRWNSAVETDGDRVRSYVALGSHANYPHNNINQLADMTSDNGEVIDGAILQNVDPLLWSNYSGLWGTYVDTLGFAGPQGPKFIDVTSQTRYLNPIGWAGIDNTTSFVAASGQRLFEAADLNAVVRFEEPLETGTKLAIDLHKEIIRFGKNLKDINLLPDFWDIITDVADESFKAQLRLSYSPAIVSTMGGREEQLGIYYYNESADEWELQPSMVDTENNIVTAEVDHFSWYAIGFVSDEVYIANIFDRLIAIIKDSDLPQFMKRVLTRMVDRIEDTMKKDSKGSAIASEQMIKVAESLFEQRWYKKYLSDEELAEAKELLGKLKGLVEMTKPHPKWDKKPFTLDYGLFKKHY